ncbi:MAG: crossover junction endodeoxyribonuclease RuvC [Candidatus Pacebacteria bacterium]|nr:crossover junction endodeoxyribonuclease RuvC [Candidatus Paceibacterota bacterium]
MLNNNTKKIIGIDPGYDRLGVSILEKKNNEYTICFSTCLTSDKKDGVNERIFKLTKEVKKIINIYEPKEMSIEKLFFTNNQKTAMGVAETRGALIFLAKDLDLKIFEYTPLQIKSALTGYGKADKNQVNFMLNQIFKFKDKTKKLDDEYDAIAVGYTHLISTK